MTSQPKRQRCAVKVVPNPYETARPTVWMLSVKRSPDGVWSSNAALLTSHSIHVAYKSLPDPRPTEDGHVDPFDALRQAAADLYAQELEAYLGGDPLW